MAVLLDSNYFVAAADPTDVYHKRAARAMRELKGERLVPVPVLGEMFYLIAERVSYRAAQASLARITNGAYILVNPTTEDFTRIQGIMQQYSTARFDFVDTVLMAMGERLNIGTIYTFDHRDFDIYRPRHLRGRYTLLP